MRPAPRTQTRLPTVTCEGDQEVSKDRNSNRRGRKTTHDNDSAVLELGGDNSSDHERD